MIGIGTIVNAFAIFAGGIIGLMIKRGIPEQVKETLLKIMGLVIFSMGILSLITNGISLENGKLVSKGFVLITLSLVFGVVVGELLNIEKRFVDLGKWFRKIFRQDGDNRFVEGFMVASILFCVGAMGIVGSINDGINGDPSLLYTKAILDGVIVIMLTSTYGVGALLSGVSVLVYQGILTLFSFAISSYVTEEIIGNISLVGALMIMCIGSNLFMDTKIRVGNILPAIFFVVLFTMINIF